ncbi:MAG: TonB-dependent receptor [Sphingobium sp.]|nr:TonB-dependent receptor [Sphingobium sp.]
MRVRLGALLLLGCAWPAAAVHAAGEEDQIKSVTVQTADADAAADADAGGTAEHQGGNKDIVVFGRGENKIGIAGAASEGGISGSDLLVRPLLKVAELLEAVPGMIAAQHSGSGKANQYFLRGFNLDHGSDFTTYIDGVQMNFRTHGHGQGYLDLNGLIPEIVSREDFRKGPYRADGGDFAMAGAAYISTVDKFDQPWVSAEVGSFGWRRAAAGATVPMGQDKNLTFALQGKVYDGPWQESEKLRHVSGFLKYSQPLGADELSISLQGYHATWNPTEQIPERIEGSAICADVFCAPDPTAKGMTTRFIGAANLRGMTYKANVSAQYYNWWMFSNPTYANADGTSAQILQFDRRWIFQANGEKFWEINDRLKFVLGGQAQLDDISNVGVYHTINRVFSDSFGAYRVTEGSLAGYAEANWTIVPGVRVIAGVRADHYWFDVKGKDAEARALGQGKGQDTVVSPKVALAWEATPWLEFYANWGRGFHSNDVRGAVTATPVPVLVAGTGKELGARFQFGKATITATYWWLGLGSELKFVGDSNAVEPTGASNRHGYEVTLFWRPVQWFAIDGNYTGSHSRYDNGDHIPNAFENAGQIGISLLPGKWKFSARLRHLGPYPLIEDNSERDKGSNVVNVRGAFAFGPAEIYAEVVNVLDSKDKDMTYFYESYIPAFDSAPTEGRMSRVLEPRTLRVGATMKF